MKIDIEKMLSERVREKGVCVAAISRSTGISDQKLYNCFNGKRKFMLDEFILVCDFLSIDPMEFLNAFAPAPA